MEVELEKIGKMRSPTKLLSIPSTLLLSRSPKIILAIAKMEDVAIKLTSIEEAQNKMLASIDEDRPTILRRLMTIENKVDSLIERDHK